MQKSFLVSILFLIAFQVFGFVPSNPDSLINNKSGGFKKIEASPSVFLSPLPEKVNETSGLIFWRNALWTHNDSGGKPEIYKIDTATGKIVQTICLDGIIAFDWEDMAQDNDFIFIGDFGNNGGDRKNLCIYKILKSSIPLNEKTATLTPSKINFSFADQKSFENNFRKNDFDCEAFFACGDSLFLFSKNWVDGNTRMYVLPKKAGEYPVSPRSTFPADGLITGTDFNEAKNEVVLVGYKNFQSFLWLFDDFDGTDFFNGQKLRVDFPDLVFVQTEGITYLDEDKILFSCERSSVAPSVFEVNSSALKLSAEKQISTYQSSGIVVNEFPAHFTKTIKFEVVSLPDSHFSVELRDKRWKKISSEKFVITEGAAPYSVLIPVGKLRSGTYFVKIISDEKSLVRKIKIEN